MLKTNRIYDLPAILMRHRLITLRKLLLPDLLKKIISLNEVTNISNDKSAAVEYYLLIEDARNSWIKKTDANGNQGWKSLKRMFFLK